MSGSFRRMLEESKARQRRALYSSGLGGSFICLWHRLTHSSRRRWDSGLDPYGWYGPAAIARTLPQEPVSNEGIAKAVAEEFGFTGLRKDRALHALDIEAGKRVGY